MYIIVLAFQEKSKTKTWYLFPHALKKWNNCVPYDKKVFPKQSICLVLYCEIFEFCFHTWKKKKKRRILEMPEQYYLSSMWLSYQFLF